MTTATAKTIQIYLPTGEPRGIRIADITTRLELAVLIPRSELAAGKSRWELDHPGVYFLFGEDEDGAKPIVYIGQTEDARKRFDSHNKTKTFWKTAVFCVSKSQNVTQSVSTKSLTIPDEAIGRRKIWREIAELARQSKSPIHLKDVCQHIGTKDPSRAAHNVRRSEAAGLIKKIGHQGGWVANR